MNYQKLRKIIKSINPDLKVVFTRAEGSYYDYETNTLGIDKDFDNAPRLGFFRHLAQAHKADVSKASETTWMILHEIGHSLTMEDLEYDEAKDLSVRMACGLLSNEAVEKSTYIQDTYYNLPLEWVATEWAKDFVENSPDTVRLLDQYA